MWSADPRQISSFPIRFLAEFFSNHGMLGFRDRPRWATVAGGSARYVEALTRPFRGAHPARLPGALDRSRRGPRRDHAAGPGGRGRRNAIRPGRDRHPLRPGARAAERPLSARARGARRDPISAQRGGAPHRQHSAPPPSLRARSVELPSAARTQGAEHRHLLHEPPAAAARRPRLLRHPEPH